MTFKLKIIAALMMICASSACKEKNYSNWKLTVARVYKIWEIDGSEVSYEYIVDGNRYTGCELVPPGAIYGDKYLILYNPVKPNECIIGDSTPFFFADDSVGYTEGEIIGDVSTGMYKNKQTVYLGFKYSVNGRKYERDQSTVFCAKPEFEIKKGMKFKVKYALNNPQSSLMLLFDSNMNVVRYLPCEDQHNIHIYQ